MIIFHYQMSLSCLSELDPNDYISTMRWDRCNHVRTSSKSKNQIESAKSFTNEWWESIRLARRDWFFNINKENNTFAFKINLNYNQGCFRNIILTLKKKFFQSFLWLLWLHYPKQSFKRKGRERNKIYKQI